MELRSNPDFKRIKEENLGAFKSLCWHRCNKSEDFIAFPGI